MTKQTKDHYDKFWKECEYVERQVDQIAQITEGYKKLYEATKNRKGIYKLINKIAYKENEKWLKKGMRLGFDQLRKLGSEFDQLKNSMMKE